MVSRSRSARCRVGPDVLVECPTALGNAFVVSLLSLTGRTPCAARLGFVTLAGVLASIATNVSYWNWYGFPTVYTAAYMFIQLVGFFCIGRVAGFLMKPKAAA